MGGKVLHRWEGGGMTIVGLSLILYKCTVLCGVLYILAAEVKCTVDCCSSQLKWSVLRTDAV